MTTILKNDNNNATSWRSHKDFYLQLLPHHTHAPPPSGLASSPKNQYQPLELRVGSPSVHQTITCNFCFFVQRYSKRVQALVLYSCHPSSPSPSPTSYFRPAGQHLTTTTHSPGSNSTQYHNLKRRGRFKIRSEYPIFTNLPRFPPNLEVHKPPLGPPATTTVLRNSNKLQPRFTDQHLIQAQTVPTDSSSTFSPPASL